MGKNNGTKQCMKHGQNTQSDAKIRITYLSFVRFCLETGLERKNASTM